MNFPFRTRLATLAAAMTSALATMASGDLPAAIDRVPAGSPLIVSVRHVGNAHDSISKLLASVGGDASMLDHIIAMFEFPGARRDGSMAVALLPGAFDRLDEDEPPMVVLVPVTNYGEFLKALGGTGRGVESVDIDGATVFFKDLGGGYAAAAPSGENLAEFAGEAGAAAGHAARIGPVGRRVADRADAVVIVDLKAVAPFIEMGFAQALEAVQFGAEMQGQDIGAQVAVIESIGNAVVNDGQAGTLGLTITADAVRADFGVAFAEGSPSANLFKHAGKASSIMAKLPKMEFLAAMATDRSHPALKRAAAVEGGGGAMQALSLTNADADGLVLGVSPGGLMAGLLTRSVFYFQSAKPDALAAEVEKNLGTMNGKNEQGIAFTTKYQRAGAQVAGRDVDAWSITTKADPNDPMGGQVSMIMATIFGPTGGPNGYLARTENGVVMTFSKSSDLMTQAINATRGSDTLDTDAGVKAVAEHLPANRSLEAYIGVKNILVMVLPMAAQVMGPIDVDIPMDMPPIGFGLAGVDGGIHATLYTPMSFIKVVGAVGEMMGGGGAGAPRF